MKNLLLLIFFFSINAAHGRQPFYTVSVFGQNQVYVKARFNLTNDTIYIFHRGVTPDLPEGEAGFVKDLVANDSMGRKLDCQYIGEGNWKISPANPGQEIEINYQMLTNHGQFNWDHCGGVDEVAFASSGGLFFTGYALFVIPDVDMQKPRIEFNLPAGWKASTPWKQTGSFQFEAESGRFLVNNCLMMGSHKESNIKFPGMEMRMAIHQQLAYALPLMTKTMQAIIPEYIGLFNAIPAPTYLVAMNPEKMTDGSAFRRSFSQIFLDSIKPSGLPAWGYIMCHEIFHLWNGTALLPATQEEWFKEGFTDYMTNLLMHRSGLIDRQMLFRKLENIARRYWLDRYWQRDTLSIREAGNEKAKNRFGVYGGGAMAALALEVEMRQVTQNRKGVEHLMRRMFQDFAQKGKPYELADIIHIVNQETGANLKGFFDRFVSGNELMNAATYLNAMGLDFQTAIEEVYVSPLPNASPAQQQLFKAIFYQKP